MATFARIVTCALLISSSLFLNGTGHVSAVSGGVWNADELWDYGWPWVACSVSTAKTVEFSGEISTTYALSGQSACIGTLPA